MRTIPIALAALAATSAGVANAQVVTPPPIGASNQDDQSGGLVVDVEGGMSAPLPILIPAMPTSSVASTPAGSTDELGRKLAQIVDDDLRNTGLFKTVGPNAARGIAYSEVTQPNYAGWSGGQALVQGYVRANGNGTLTIGCYLYDLAAQTELVRQGFVVSPGDWRRAAHKCADSIYTRLTGEGPYFDSQIVYVAEQGPKGKRRKQIAIMDQDGANHRFLTNGQNIVLTPRMSPKQNAIVYMSYENRRPSIWIYNMSARTNRRLVENVSQNFAPHFSPDGRSILFSMSVAGNTDIYRISVNGGQPQRLTNVPGIDTGGSYSPDGSRIVFESDRGGTQQLYVMNADGSNQKRISFGGGRYATPVWSPRGDLIAFTRTGGGAFRIGVMNASGGGEKLLTNAWGDEGPTWSPNGRVLMFFRASQGSGKPDLWSVDLTGVNARKIPTPLDGSDPSWGPIRP
ncbi:Tol-Pal system beta propeller repeat protein TolB [Sphingomonas sp. DG1-23]|uniref:Tol-Pal system beta propeller repeat protein TolB n=1 Tax=Sphingomonas sp. DG1-23 TaxID=3068316 RepID=UPI00273F27C7|nr:Tol-Pal system beta propeller repeat protein TolB [Sphingomonas sp. DG1-23]MDP5277639.1 Tol-Pal system beta propeller repeat protein TolB [Sphingomonas sp. DG1-23]